MTISELICRLQAIKCSHGDIEIVIGSPAEWNLASNAEMKLLLDDRNEFHEYACIS